MTNRLYSAFDPSALGAGLDLSQSNTIITVNQTTTISRTARALYGKSAGSLYAEFMVWGPGTLAGYASVGVVDASASLTTYVGGDSHGCGYRIGDGKIYVNNASVATVAVGKVGDIVGVGLTFDGSGNGSVTFSLNGTMLSTQSLSPGTYFLAASIGGAQAGDMQCLLNTGSRGFEFGAGGWYIVPPLLNSLYLGSSEYLTGTADDPASTPFDSTIVDGQQFAVLRQLNFAIQGGGAVTPATASLEIANPQGQYDTVLTAEMIDRPVILQELASESSAYSTATGAGNFVIAGIQAQNESTLQISLKDSIAILDLPLQDHLILPNAEGNAVNQPWQFVLGSARNVPLTLLDARAYTYAVSDVPVVGFGLVRDKGDPFDPNASPPDYTIDVTRTKITLGSQAQGLVTGDFSSIGGGAIPTPANDIFAGKGKPFAGTVGSTPTGWAQGWTGGAAALASGGNVQIDNTHKSLKLATAATMLSHRSYRVTLTLVGASGTTTNGTKGVRVGIKVAQGGQYIWQIPPVAGTYSTVITNQGADFEPVLTATDDATPVTPNVVLRDYSLLQIADTYTPDAILPIKLADFVAAIMQKVNRNGVAIPYSRADCEAIDAATGYAGIGYAAISATTARDALSAALASYCACAWMDATGTLRFTRLAVPEDLVATVSLDTSDFLSDMQYLQDDLPGLTSQVGYRYNWQIFTDSDFVTDFIDVPASTRAAFKRQCQGVAATAANFSPCYAHAVFADPYWSLLDRQQDAQALADYFGRIGSRQRGTYQVDLPRGTVSLGQIASVTHTRYGLTAGRNLQVLKISERQLDEIDTVTFWG